jgi:hypothetical protein
VTDCMADFCTYLCTCMVQVLSCMQPVVMVGNTGFLPVKYFNMPQFVSVQIGPDHTKHAEISSTVKGL